MNATRQMFGAILFALAVTASLHAQSPRTKSTRPISNPKIDQEISLARIEILVTDTHGKPVPYPNVTATWLKSFVPFKGDRQGIVRLPAPLAGTGYQFSAGGKGFRPRRSRKFNFSERLRKGAENGAKFRYIIRLTRDTTASTTTTSRPKRIETVQYPVSLYGSNFWKLVRGDSEMATNGNKYASAEYRATISVEGNRIWLKLNFNVKEHGGDQTEFLGVERMIVYTAPAGRRIVGIKSSSRATFGMAPLSANDRKQHIGKFHGKGNFDKDGIWEFAKYRLDSRGKDGDDIGIEGMLNFYVLLE